MSLSDLEKDFGTWADATFDDPPIQAYGRKLAHEVDELIQDLDKMGPEECATNIPNLGAELADCLLVLCAIANRAGVDLELQAWRKYEINKRRSWVRQADGTHQHIK